MKDCPKVFISHSSQNIEIVQHFCSALTSIGIDAENVFCSSISGQGVNNGQKLNDAIFAAIESSDLLIYFISYDFINSPYCVEELGVGWYRSQKGESDCYYLLIPDVSFSDISGFINSKIDKFTVISGEHKSDFGLLLENICEKRSLPMPRLSTFLNVERVFFDAVRVPVEQAQRAREIHRHNEIQKAEQEKKLYEHISALENQINETKIARKKEARLTENEKLLLELKTIKERFMYLGFGTGITKEAYNGLYKEFLLSMAERYIELENMFPQENPEMELLLACIFSHEGKLDEAYHHLINHVFFTDGSLYPNFFENIEIDKNNDMSELLSILENRIKTGRPGVVMDLYKYTLDTLKELHCGNWR